MTAFCSYTGCESHTPVTPLIYRFVYNVLSNAVPYTQQALTLFVDVIYTFLVDPLLHYSPADLIIHGVHIWSVWGHWSGEMKSGVSRRKSAIVSRALWTGALSCWNMKLCNLEWKWTATIVIVVKYCWRRSCCHASRKYWVTISYSNRTAHLHTGCDRSMACMTQHRHFKFHKVVRQQT